MSTFGTGGRMTPPHDDEVTLWRECSVRAGHALMGWYQKSPRMINMFAPSLPRVAEVLMRGDVNEMRRLLDEIGA